VYLASEGSSFSFNTAIVTFINHGSPVYLENAILTLVHEFGHCFGSNHDDMEGKWLVPDSNMLLMAGVKAVANRTLAPAGGGGPLRVTQARASGATGGRGVASDSSVAVEEIRSPN
jgi:hypothetical protein